MVGRLLNRGLSAASMVVIAILLVTLRSPAALEAVETAYFEPQVAAGELPAIAERLPAAPWIVTFDDPQDQALGRTVGKPGGELRTLIGNTKDVRLMVVYGYARLVGYNADYKLVPDLLADFDVQEGRIFTFTLREGHKWSDGHPFTTEDFRYWWEDVANNAELLPSGPPVDMLVDGQPPKFEILSDTQIRFTWDQPNPYFLPRLAGASPLFIYRPAHYLQKFHAKYADPTDLEVALKEARKRKWASLHNRLDNQYRFDNIDLPTLQPWVNKTKPPATRFIMERNPFYHRIDANGHQLPYLDKVILNVSDNKLIPAKAGTGESDLQARGIAFNNYAFLKENEEQAGFQTHLWRIAKGAQIALFPNLNNNDPVWRDLFRDVRFRRALSLAIDRNAINESLFFGLAHEANNTILPDSPLFREEYQTKWTEFDLDLAEELLDEIGVDSFNEDDIRQLPDGRPLEIIVETAGEDTEQSDVLQLVQENWAEIGIKLLIKPSQRDVFRNRIFSGETQMSVWFGLENGVPSADMSPRELAPTSQQQLQWPKWGQYYETKGKSGEAPDLPLAQELLELQEAWLQDSDLAAREALWHQMLEIYVDQVYSIGIISGTHQPIVVKDHVKNVPSEAVYNWDPGAHFGIYRPDSFWLDK